LGLQYDVVHVDALHTKEGCFHECQLGWSVLRPNGTLLVDDAYGEVLQGIEQFSKFVDVPYTIYKTHNKLAEFRKP